MEKGRLDHKELRVSDERTPTKSGRAAPGCTYLAGEDFFVIQLLLHPVHELVDVVCIGNESMCQWDDPKYAN